MSSGDKGIVMANLDMSDVKVASFKEFTAENAVGQYMHISTHTCTSHMHQFEVWS